ncbi:Ger(x)C family spore germination protein [Alkalihalobacterium elongatum]|uniref:Ger(x)C family spore germination protein n=1 Tax=Alkalihalobacterium elongatum TaxID=2675466 RepID=UPI001C1F2013|nr:Ger(x)C family spore germination protein [Alkalihalobacterium elongatum]
MRKKDVVTVLFTVSFLLTGCWNAQELTDLSLISAVGIDKTDQGEFNVSFQIINAGEVATGQEGGQRNAVTTIVYSSPGQTVFEAIRRTTKKVPRKIYFPHTSLIVISEQFAKEEGIDKLIDWFERDHEFRTNIQVVIARNITAEEILMIQSPVERIAAKKITNEIETSERVWGENIVTEIDDVIQALVSKGKEITMSGVTLVGDIKLGGTMDNLQESYPPASLELNGLALFKDGRLIRWLEGREARGTSWVLDRIQSTIVNLDCNGKTDAIAIEVIRSQTNVQANIVEGKPEFKVIIDEEGNIAEADCSIDISSFEVINQLEQQLSARIKDEALSVIQVAQQEKADILGFGNVVERQFPHDWDKYENEWSKIFSTVEVDVEVNAFIRRSGMRINSFRN